MSKMHYFRNKFSKIAKHWGLSVLSWSWLWRNQTSKYSYDVISV